MQAVLAVVVVVVAIPSDAPVEPVSEQAHDTILVLPLRALGVESSEAEAVTIQVAEALAEHDQRRVIMVSEIDTLVQQQTELVMTGCGDDACIAEVSKAANSRFVLAGSLGRVGDDVLLSLTLFDSKISGAAGKSSRSVASLAAVQEAVPDVLAEVFGWSGAMADKPRYVLPQGRGISFAVFDIKPLGIEDDVAQNLTQVLAAQIKQIEGTKVISRDDIVSMLELQADQMRFDCIDDTSCLAEIGGALGVEKLVVGHAGKLGQDFVVSLRLIDVDTVSVDNRVTESFTGLKSQLLRAIGHAGRRLLGVEAPDVGVLALTGSQPAAVVALDNETIGALPMHPVERLLPGRHTVRITKDGFFDWRSDFYVEPGGVTPLWVDLEAIPPAWYERWWVWATAAGVIVTTVATVVGVVYWQETRLPDSDLGNYPAR